MNIIGANTWFLREEIKRLKAQGIVKPTFIALSVARASGRRVGSIHLKGRSNVIGAY